MPNTDTRFGLFWRALVVVALCIALSLAGAGCRTTESVDSEVNIPQNIEPIPEYDVIHPNEHGPVNGLCQEHAADYAGELCQAYAADYAQVYVLAMFWPSCVVQTVNSVNSEGRYTLASVDWAPNGDWAQASNVNTGDYSKHRFAVDMVTERPPEPEEVGGLPLAKAKQCFLDICRAQDKALNDAEVRYPGWE